MSDDRPDQDGGGGSDLPPAVRAWGGALGGLDDAARRQAALSLVNTGLELAAVLPGLGPLLPYLSGTAKARAAADLGRLGARLAGVVPGFRDALRRAVLTDPDEEVRTSALHALALLGHTAAPPVPALVAALRDGVAAVRAEAADGLGQLGTDAREAVSALIPVCLYDPDPAVRVRAGVALWRCGRRLHPTLAALCEGVRGDDPLLRWAAADCLGDIGPDAAAAVPALMEAVGRTAVRLVATSLVLALERIDPRVAATVALR